MKILRITNFGFESGGVENGIALVNPLFRKMGHEVRVFSSDTKSKGLHFSDYEFKNFDNEPKLLRILYRLFYPESYFKLKKVLEDYKPDIVQVHTLHSVSPSVLFLLKKYPTVLTIHGAEFYTRSLMIWNFPPSFFKNHVYSINTLNLLGSFHYYFHYYISNFIYKLAFKNVDAFVVLSRYMKEILEKEGLNCIYIPNATTLFEYEPINLKSKIISYVGRLEKLKGVDILIKSMSALIKIHPDIKLKIAGDGDYKSDLEQIVLQQGLKNHVEFVGRLDRGELNELYKSIALLVVPSIWPEPFGKIGIEAMSVGRPVVASNVGGISEWLQDGVQGFLVEPGNSEELALAISKILGNPEVLEEMSILSRKQAEKFDLNQHAEKVIKLYEKVVDNYTVKR